MKQRLVGAVVLVSIAVIFLPMIFDRPHEQHRDLIVPIPDQPPRRSLISLPNQPSLKPPIKSHEEDVSRMASQARSTLSGSSVSVQDIEQTATELATANPVKVVPVKRNLRKQIPWLLRPVWKKSRGVDHQTSSFNSENRDSAGNSKNPTTINRYSKEVDGAAGVVWGHKLTRQFV